VSNLDPETRADLDQLWHAIQTYVHCNCADGCPSCNAVDVDAVRATVAYQRIQAKLKKRPEQEPQGAPNYPSYCRVLCGWCGEPATCMGLWSKACARCCAVHHTRKSGEKTCDRRVGK